PAPSMVISPDGTTVVFVARDSGGTGSLRVRRLEGPDTIELAGTEGARQPFFSPDSAWIGFFDGGLMTRVSLSSGDPPSIITSVKLETYGASWGPDDRIYYSDGRSGLKSVSVSGGKPQVVTQLDVERGEGSHRLPHHVPNHQVLLLSIFIDGTTQIKHETWALNLTSGESFYLFDGLAAAYIDLGYILFTKAESTDRSQEVMGGSLWAVPFNAESMVLTGPERPIQNAVAGREGTAYTVARSGTLIYLPKQGETVGELVLLESNGSRVLAEGPMFEHPQFSNDGKSIAVTTIEEGKTPSIRIYGIESGVIRQFSDGARFPLWDPDDQGITFMKNDVGLLRRRLDTAKPAERLVSHDRMIVPLAWINQGHTLLYHAVNPETNSNVYTMESGNEPRQIFKPGATFPNITIDQRWVSFCTWPHGVYVGSFPDVTSLFTVTDAGCAPHWSGGNKRLYYQEFNKLWAVDVNIADGFSFGKRESIADLGYPGVSLFDIDKDGRVVYARHKNTAPKQPVLLMNWASLLE
ncbi:MAG: TolB family protein, partial [Pseudomonadales bacterium]